MAGSQLKKLKEALKANGLSGPVQQNKKGRGKKGKQSREYDREERQRVISRIREEFNPFDIKTNRNKHGPANDEGTNNKSTKIAVGKPGISKQVGEEQRQQVYSAKKGSKGKASAFIDKRFGERNKALTDEEKMLERFTRERQHESAKKRSLFDLEDEGSDSNDFENDTDMYGTKLTHYGQSLSFEDDFQEDDLGADEPMTSRKRVSFDQAGDSELEPSQEPQRKKTKAEVMQEVIAKSKFYKHERQKKQEELLDQIQDLDDNFDDLVSELQKIPKKQLQPSSKFVDQAKAVEEGFKDYDLKVKELGLEKRAAPSERTKTEEELQKEKDDQMKKLEQDRTNRMNGIFEYDGAEEHEEAVDVEKLDDGFWGDSEEELEMEDANIPDSEDDVHFSDEDQTTEGASSHKARSIPSVPCPQMHAELLTFLESYPTEEHVSLIKRVIRTYQPKLAEGNKQKLDTFTGVLLRHIMFLASKDYSNDLQTFESVQNSLISILKLLSEKYNRGLTESCREIIEEIQARYEEEGFEGLDPGVLIFFSIVGYLFSTSDHYHLVVTPCNILMGEFLDQSVYTLTNMKPLIFSTILSNVAVKYQNLSKRYFPEVSYFLVKSLNNLLPLVSNFEYEKQNTGCLPIHSLFQTSYSVSTSALLLRNQLNLVSLLITGFWRDLSAFPEILLPFQALFEKHLENKHVSEISEKITKLLKFNIHNPLTLQNHKPLAIPTYAPKYEENYNPEKKSYSTDRTKNEIDKMKAQLKKERKFTMKELRKDAKFEARQQIDEKKKSYKDYHSKMARIVNTINTEEGAEKNKYERERKLRTGKK